MNEPPLISQPQTETKSPYVIAMEALFSALSFISIGLALFSTVLLVVLCLAVREERVQLQVNSQMTKYLANHGEITK